MKTMMICLCICIVMSPTLTPTIDELWEYINSLNISTFTTEELTYTIAMRGYAVMQNGTVVFPNETINLHDVITSVG